MILSTTCIGSTLLLLLTTFMCSILLKRRARKDEPPIVPYIIPFVGMFFIKKLNYS